MVGDMTGKGYVEMQKKIDRPFKVPPTSDARFETIETLPKISSKYRNSDQGFSLDKMTHRNPNFLVQPSHGMFLSPE